jgi:hypothetical protein
VKVVAKVKRNEEINKEKYNLVNGPGVEVVELPWYQGLSQMIKKLPQLIKIYRKIGNDVDCYVFRIAQVESFFTYLLRKKDGKPFAVEVVNDPETFVDMNGFMRNFSVKMVKKMCDLVIEKEPWMAEYLVPKCETLGYCDEIRGCGRVAQKQK